MELSETIFERSLRLRQIALQASQAAILETRIARAHRSRPSRQPIEEFIPGTTKVEIYRDDGGGQGWRGPATVLQVNEKTGTAIVEFQHRPYLISLRHLRPPREAFLNCILQPQHQQGRQAGSCHASRGSSEPTEESRRGDHSLSTVYGWAGDEDQGW